MAFWLLIFKDGGSAGGGKDTAKTGDEAKILCWILLMVAAATTLAVATGATRKRNEKDI